MVLIIKKGENISAAKNQMQDLKGKKSFDSKKHQGVIKLNDTPLNIQNQLRNEWK